MSSTNIQIAIKVRPFIDREKKEKLEPLWLVKENNIIQTDSTQNFIGEPYSFDHIFDATKSNKDVYDSVVKPLVMSCLEGINSTIFAYGQTSSGKTHTMLGDKNIPGIINYTVEDIFSYVKATTTKNFLLRCSYIEIYNEKINDLLDKEAKNIKIREDYNQMVYVDVKEEVVRKPEELFMLMMKGMKTRKIGCTDLNERSSRSHTIFRLVIQSQNAESEGSYTESTLSLVDLAGSERVGQMNMGRVRQVEGVNINKSLTTLGLVIRKLSDNESYVNFRDSKLTRLLQYSLGGNSRTLIIATITIAVAEETKSTLEFAQRAKYVQNRPIINKKVTDKDQLKQYEHLCEDYKEQIEKLKMEKIERDKTINTLEDKISNIKLFTAGTLEKINRPTRIPNRRHTLAHCKPRKKTFFIKEPGGLEETSESEEPVGFTSPANSQTVSQRTLVNNKENSFFENSIMSSYDTDFKNINDDGNLNICENLVKMAENSEIYEKLIILKNILEVKPFEQMRRNSLDAILEEEIDQLNDDFDWSISNHEITNEYGQCEDTSEEINRLKQQLSEKDLIIDNLRNDINKEKIINAGIEESQELLVELNELKSKNEYLNLQLNQTLSEKNCLIEENAQLKSELEDTMFQLNGEQKELENCFQLLEKKTREIDDLKQIISTLQNSQKQIDLTQELIRPNSNIQEQHFEKEVLFNMDENLQPYLKDLHSKDKNELQTNAVDELREKLPCEISENKQKIEADERILNEFLVDHASLKEDIESNLKDIQRLQFLSGIQETKITELEQQLHLKTIEFDQKNSSYNELFSIYNEQCKRASDLDTEICQLKKERADLTTQLYCITHELDIKQEQIYKLKDDLKITSEEFGKLNKVEDKSRIIEELQDVLSDTRRQLNDLQTENNKFNQEVMELTSKLSRVTLELNIKQEETCKLRDDLKIKSEEIEKLNEDGDKLNTIKELETILSDTKRQLNDLQIDNSKSNEKVMDLTSKLSQVTFELNIKQEEIYKLMNNLKIKSEEIEKLNEDEGDKLIVIKKLESVLLDTKRQLKDLQIETDKSNEEVMELRTQLSCVTLELNVKQEELCKLKDDLKVKSEQIQKLTESGDKLNAIKELESILSDTKRQLKDSQIDASKSNEKVMELTSKLSCATHELNMKREEIDHLKGNLQLKYEEIEELKAGGDKICKIEELESLLSHTKHQLKDLQTETNKSNEEVIELTSKLSCVTLELNNKQEEIHKLRKELKIKSEQIENISEDKANLSSVKELENIVLRTKRQLQDLRAETIKSNKDSIELSSRLSHVTRELKLKQEEVHTLKEQLEICKSNKEVVELTSKLSEVTYELNSKQEEIHKLRAELKAKSQEIQKLNNDRATLSATKELENVLDVTKHQLKDLQTETNKSKKNEIELTSQLSCAMLELKVKKEEVHKLTEDLKIKINEIEKINEDNSKSSTAMKELENELAHTKCQLQDSQTKICKYNKEVADLTSQLTYVTCKLDMKEKEVDTLKDNLKVRSEETDNLLQDRSKLATIKELETVLSDTKCQLKALQAETCQSKKEVVDLTSKLSSVTHELNIKQDGVEKLRADLKEKCEEIVNFGNDKLKLTAAKQTETNLLEHQLKHLEAEIDISNKEALELASELSCVTRELKIKQEEVLILKEELKNKSAEIEKFIENMDQLNNIKDIENDLLDTKRQLKDRCQDIRRQKSKHDALEGQLLSCKKDLADKNRKYEKELAKNADLEKQINEFSIDAKRISRELVEAKKEISMKSSQLVLAHEELQKIKNLTGDVEKLQLEHKQCKLQIEDLEQNRKTFEKRYCSLESQFESEKRHVQSLNKKLESRDNDIISLQKKVCDLMRYKKGLKDSQTDKDSKPRLLDESRPSSPNDLRKNKRHSLHDQRRGLTNSIELLDDDLATIISTGNIQKKLCDVIEENKELQNELLQTREIIECCKYKISKLEDKNFEDNQVQNIRKADKSTQATCDMYKKYKEARNIARSRREESNFLRAKLGLPADCPVLPQHL